MTATVIVLVATALLFTAIFTVVVAGHDTPNSIALPVRAQALTPGVGMVLVAVMRAIGVFIGVASLRVLPWDITGLVPKGPVGLVPVLIAVLTALSWALFTWWRSVPVSSSHALSAALLGGLAAFFLTGILIPNWQAVRIETIFLIAAVILSPLAGMIISWVVVFFSLFIFRNRSTRVVSYSARVILSVTAAANAFGHGIQYGLRIYVICWLILTSAGVESVGPLATSTIIALLLAAGTFLGGWRIAHTLTHRLVDLDQGRASIASLSAALLLVGGSFALSLPISSTLTTGGAIVGAGGLQQHKAVRWSQVARLTRYSVLTLLLCGLMAFILCAAVSPLAELL